MSMNKKDLDKAVKMQREFTRLHEDPDGLIMIAEWGVQIKEQSLVDLSHELGKEIQTNEEYSSGWAKRWFSYNGIEIYCLSKRDVKNVKPK